MLKSQVKRRFNKDIFRVIVLKELWTFSKMIDKDTFFSNTRSKNTDKPMF